MWNARRLRPSTVVKDALHALSLDAADVVDCYRWLRELHHAKYQQPRFISVDLSKVDPSRSISPTSVDDVGAVSHHTMTAAAEPAQSTAAEGSKAKRKLSSSSDASSDSAERATSTTDVLKYKRARSSAC